MKGNQLKVTLESDSNVPFPKESDQIPAWLEADKWLLQQTKEGMPKTVVVLWRKMLVATKNIQNFLW
jgi:hypothetical protein